jgi:hypothetical protein
MPDINVIGVAHDRAVAEQIVGNCRLAGFAQDDVLKMSMIKPAKGRKKLQEASPRAR